MGPVPDINTGGEMNAPTTSLVTLRLWKGEDKHTRCKECRRKSKNWGRGGKEGASEPGLCNGNHMAGGCGSDAPRLLGEAAKQPDTFQETGGKYFLGLHPRHHSWHQKARKERAGGGGRGARGQPLEDREG